MLFTEVDRALNEGMTIEFDLAESGARVRQVRFLEAGGPGTVAEGYGLTIEAALAEACMNYAIHRPPRTMAIDSLSSGLPNAQSDLDHLVWQGFRLRLRRKNKRTFACELRQDDRRVERLVRATSFLDALLRLGQEQLAVSAA